MTFTYPAVFTEKEDGTGYHAFFPDLEMCEADGADLDPCQPRLQPFRADQAGSRCSGRQYFRGIRLGNTPHENVRHLRRRRPSRRSRGDPAALGSP